LCDALQSNTVRRMVFICLALHVVYCIMQTLTSLDLTGNRIHNGDIECLKKLKKNKGLNVEW
jgi:hypothetical protein